MRLAAGCLKLLKQHGAVGVHRPDSREDHSEDHSWGQTIERLDRVSRAMNPLLLLIAVALVVLNLACVVNLIDWRTPSQSSAAPAAAAAAPGTAAVDGPHGAHHPEGRPH